MSTRRRYAVLCDGRDCQEWIQTEERSPVAARRVAVKCGWSEDDGLDLCVYCTELPRHERQCIVLLYPSGPRTSPDGPPREE